MNKVESKERKVYESQKTEIPRIISDILIKDAKPILGRDPNTNFNQIITAINNMYVWLYNEGFLQKEAFCLKDYADATYFAIDVKDLEKYRKRMEDSNILGTSLAVEHIFDTPHTPCIYSGAIELSWTMKTYRNECGCVSSSWECELVRCLDNEKAYQIADLRKDRGVKAAVKKMFEITKWKAEGVLCDEVGYKPF